MRFTVNKILQTEAERLLDRATHTGLQMADLSYLDKLIATYKAFVGDTPASDNPPETPPEASSTEALLDSVKQAALLGQTPV